MKTPAKYMTGTTVLPFNPAAFGEVGLACISILLSLKLLKDNITPKEMSVKFLCSRQTFVVVSSFFVRLFIRKTVFGRWYYFNS